MRHLASILALGLAACYQPRPAGELSCAVTCGPAGECPPGMQCAPNGMCFGADVAGCGGGVDGPPVGSGSDAGGGRDGSGSGGSGGSDGGTPACYGSHLQVCFGSAPLGDTTISTPIDTDSDPRCTSPASVTPPIDACFIQGGSIEIQGTVRATGSRPLVLVAAQTITIDGPDVLDLRGDRNARAAGAEINCSTNNLDGKSGTPAGGGAGGSYVTQGGTGGAGGGNGGGTAAGTVQPAYRGGCAGGDGGNANNGATKAGHGGGGGGAVYLVAGESITVSGTINASGQGGDGGDHGFRIGGLGVGGSDAPGAGGGGGGAGGLIGLEAPTVTASGVLIANGGGGGAGGPGGNTNTNGADGATPDGSTTSPASGATGSGGAGNGGDGYGTTSGTPVQAGSASSGGAQNSGGGGGGGGGAIWIYATTRNVTARVSPNPTP